MPGLDKTRPQGQGPMTGRGLGLGGDDSGQSNADRPRLGRFGRGLGRFGRGRFGRGLGLGQKNN